MADGLEKAKDFVRHIDHDELYDNTISSMIEHTKENGFSEEDADEAVYALIREQELLVHVTLSRLDDECTVRKRGFTEGVSTTDDIVAEYGQQPHVAVTRPDGGETWIYDIYAEYDFDTFPHDPRPHAIRDQEDFTRNAGWMLPATAVLPEEALQISFYFNENKILNLYRIAVGLRFT